MAFISSSATVALKLKLFGEGTEHMSSSETMALSLTMTGDLQKITRIKRAKPTSNTRIRVDFTAPVDNNAALVNPDNWNMYGFNDAELSTPAVLAVEVPSSAGTTTKYVIVIVSPMLDSAAYLLTVNSEQLLIGADAFLDSDMSQVGTIGTYWSIAGFATLLTGFDGTFNYIQAQTTVSGKQGGIFQQYNAGYGQCYQIQAKYQNAFAPNFIVQYRPVGGPPVVIWQDSSPPAPGTWNDVLPSNGNTALFYLPEGPGWFEFIVYDPAGTAEGWWTEVIAQPVFGYGSSSGSLITSFGNPVSKDAAAFYGVGVKPFVKMVIATDANTVSIYFSEPIATDSKLLSLDVSNFTWDNGLTTTKIMQVESDTIILSTSDQTEGELYQLTINGATIRDLVGNLLAQPYMVAMLGFTASPLPAPAQVLDMYRFILQSIRDEDQANGGQFIQRLFGGPQQMWEQTTQLALEIPNIWNLDAVPDQLLVYVKNIVGWTDRYNPITSKLDPDSLRRLISVSVTFWKQRGVEDIIEDILRMITGTQVRVLNWFWYRWILGETALGEDHLGIDPWLLSSPGEGPDSQTYAVRIVDNGTLDYDMIRHILKLTRPCGERVEVDYVTFSDLFPTDNIKTQWHDQSGTSTVSGQMLHLLDTVIDEDTETYTNNGVNISDDWSDLTATFRIRGTGVYYMDVYRSDVPGGADAYRMEIDIANNSITLKALSAGVATTLGTYYPGPPHNVHGTELLVANIFYTFRITVTPTLPGSVQNNLQVFWEADLVISATDSTLDHGTMAVGHYSGGTMELSEVEMFLNPMTTDFIDINPGD